MLKLERMNPTDAPAESVELNGMWELLYSSGLSPGMLAVSLVSRLSKQFQRFLDLKAVTLTIKREQPRVEASVAVGVFGTERTLRVR
ncbi:unnamed protein product, partial [Phaeothamnion confervicola]